MSLKGVVYQGTTVIVRGDNSPSATGASLVTLHFVTRSGDTHKDGFALTAGQRGKIEAKVPADALSMIVVIDMKDGDSGTTTVAIEEGGSAIVPPEAIVNDPTTWSFAVLP